MAERLDAADAAFLHVEDSGGPQHVGTLAVCHDPTGRLDHSALLALVRHHLPTVPRYRQVVREVPARLANPVWVDDEGFDLGYHVRCSALPRPGTDDQLHELVARIMSRPLDRAHPLWELYFVEGMSDDRVAILSKSHHALVDGVTTVDIGQLVPDPRVPSRTGSGPGVDDRGALADGDVVDGWRPAAGPSPAALVLDALLDVARQPSQVVDAVRHGVSDVRTSAERLAQAAVSVATAARAAILPGPDSPLRSRTGAARLFSTVDTSLADYKAVRAALGGSINDVVLAAITGALRTWLQTRGEPVATGATVRAVVPVSVRDAPEGFEEGAALDLRLGGSVSSYLVDLPVGEPSAVMRLHQVGYATQAHKDTGRAVGAGTLVQLSGFAPPTLHALGARVASTLARRGSHLVVTNVPGPQSPLFVAGALLLRSYPVAPLAPGQAVSIGITSYDGGVYYGLNADRDTMPDVAVLGQCITDSLDELVEATR